MIFCNDDILAMPPPRLQVLGMLQLFIFFMCSVFFVLSSFMYSVFFVLSFLCVLYSLFYLLLCVLCSLFYLLLCVLYSLFYLLLCVLCFFFFCVFSVLFFDVCFDAEFVLHANLLQFVFRVFFLF